jgi:AraC family transcriptional regulator, positive regulator of tynA and feaB
MTVWTTETVESNDRFSFWREVVCQTVLNVSTEAPPDRFWARISGRSFGDLRFAAFDSSSHDIVRDKQHLAGAPSDNYLVSLQRKGRCHITQGSDAFLLNPGEIAIVDGQEPFRVTFPDTVSRILAVVPKKTLDARAPWLRKLTQRKIAADSKFAELTRLHLLELATSHHELAGTEVDLLTDSLCNLLSLSLAHESPAGARHSSPQFAAILAFCRHNLTSTDLSPHKVAAHFGISVRTLHSRFEQAGRTFTRWVIDNRLEASRIALRDPAQRALSISEIAYRCGFNDLSHFDKAFRARYDRTPRGWRKENDVRDLEIAPPRK